MRRTAIGVVCLTLPLGGCSLTTPLDGLAGGPLDASVDVALADGPAEEGDAGEADATGDGEGGEPDGAEDAVQEDSAQEAAEDAPGDVGLDTTCGTGLSMCGTSCIDTLSDSAHCGVCDRDCLGGTCVNARCQPVLLAQDVPGALTLVVSGGFAYWVNRSTGVVWRVKAQANETKQQIYAGDTNAEDIAVLGESVFWNTTGTGVFRCNSDGTGFVKLVTGSDISSIALMPPYLYYDTLWPSGGIYRTLMSPSGAVDLLTTAVTHPKRLAVSGQYLYIAHSTKGIWRLDTAQPTAAPVLLVGGNKSAHHVVVSQGSLFWTSWVDGAVFQASLDGSAQTTLAAMQTFASYVAVDDKSVYWTVWGNPGVLDGAVRRTPIGGGAIETLVDGQPRPFGMGLTASAVVWANYDSGEIKLVAK